MASAVFVLFASGMGGSQLANLMSTATNHKFASRVTDEMYERMRIGTRVTAHPIGREELLNLDHAAELIELNQGTILFPCHLAEYLWRKDRIDSMFDDKKYVVVEFPEHTRNSVLSARLKQKFPAYDNQYFLEEMSTIYSIDIIKKLVGGDDYTSITVDMLFTSDCDPLRNRLKNELGLEFNVEHFRYLHTTWFDMIQRVGGVSNDNAS